MGQSDDVEDSTYNKHQDLCQKLNMDASAASEAWRSYEEIRQKYTLEGDQLHWIGCALYVACRKSTAPTVGKTGTQVEGNCVSLTRLLRLCNLPLIEFFSKSKAWADMCNMPQDFGSRIEKLERKFAVSAVIFQKFQPIFTDIFKPPSDEVAVPSTKSRRHKVLPCTTSRLFEFCWSLFVCIKGAVPNISDDLVNSYHLLLVVCDLIYLNVVTAYKLELLNPNFPGVAEILLEEKKSAESVACIVNILCERHEAIAVEAIGIKEYSMKRYLTKLFTESTLRGDAATFAGILEPYNLDGNIKAINKTYEQHVLNVGDFDERIFLAEWRRVRLNGISRLEFVGGEIGSRALSNRHTSPKDPEASHKIGSSPNRIVNVSDLREQCQERTRQEQYGAQMQHLAPATPLTGRKYLKMKDISNVTPVSSATQSVIRLQTLLVGCKNAPSEKLLEMFSNSSEMKSFVESKIAMLGAKFCDSYTQKNVGEEKDRSDEKSASKTAEKTDKPLEKSAEKTSDPNTLDFGQLRLQSSQTLFYKILEMVLADEKAKKPNFNVKSLVMHDVFLQCLFACCCEIVVYSYQNKDRTFPWILNALNVEAYYFYKVIEVTVKVAVDQLTRDMVKHLNRIEELILESLAWQSNSPLWKEIDDADNNKNVPSCEDVALPGSFEALDPNTPGQPVLRRIALDRGAHHDVQQSPISSVSERFNSPISASGVCKKRLNFPDNNQQVPVASGTSILRGQSVLSPKVVDGNQTRVVVVSDQTNVTPKTTSGPVGSTPLPATMAIREPSKPRRTGSIALFFRKFYNLTSARMITLCTDLDITDIDIQRKIWTIFEYSIKDRTTLMKDRHLDQILMCAVYVICKLACIIEKNSFTEIMRCYRLQPQAASHIYRSVLISKNEDGSATLENEAARVNNFAPPPTPTDMAGTSRNFGSETRGDLIKFYNTVYVPEVKQFVNKLGLADGNISSSTLSPLPRSRPVISSPLRRVTDSVMTRVLDPKDITASPAPQLIYSFSRSPAKDLEAINRMVTSIDARKTIGKRLLSDDAEVQMINDEPPIKKRIPFVTRKIENIMGERRLQSQ